MIDRLLAGISILASILGFIVLPVIAIYWHNNYIPLIGVIIVILVAIFLYSNQKRLDYKINKQEDHNYTVTMVIEEKVLSRVNIIAKNEGLANFRARILSCQLADKTGHPITYKLSKGWVEEYGHKAITITPTKRKEYIHLHSKWKKIEERL